MNKRRSMLITLGLATACSKAQPPATAPSVPSADAAWLRPVPKGEMAAIYFTIHNPTDVPLVLTGVAVGGVPHATFHESMEHGGMAHMSDRDSLVVAAHDSVVFAPRALHVMAHGVPRALASGDTIGVRVTTRNGPALTTRATVRE
ncbi:MAG: copper chaperone PCu(A)C [Gemmatimonadaceae bacterium]|nr:copper chaperone PCu(A)C [Gemmatimonadaceae bacterium]